MGIELSWDEFIVNPWEVSVSRTGRTIGAALGALIFVLFFATIADRFANPVSAAEPVAKVTTAP
jgi:hypothetical protein